MHHATFSTSRVILVAILLTSGLLPQISGAQSIVRIDPFDWATPTLTVTAKDTSKVGSKGTALEQGLYTLGSGIGHEADVVASLPEHTDNSILTLQADPILGGVHVSSTPDATAQIFITWDGRDFDPFTLHATDGFDPTDFTAGGTLDAISVHIANVGPALNLAFLAFANAQNYSEYQISIPQNTDAIYKVPFIDFSTTGNNDWTSVRAFAAFAGVDGGAPGPMDLRLWDLGLGKQEPTPPSMGGAFTLDHTGATIGHDVFANNLSSDPQNAKYSGEVASRFTLDNPTTLRSLTTFGGFYASIPPAPTFDVAILNDNNGLPGEPVWKVTLPVTYSDSRFKLAFPQDMPLLPANTYWISEALNAVYGTDGFLGGSPDLFGTEAYYRNPSGAFGHGTDWAPAYIFESGVKSIRLKLEGEYSDQPLGDIEVKKVASDSTVKIGDQITFTITATNRGDIESLDTGIEDFFEGVEIVSLTPSQGSCDQSGDVVLGSVSVVACELGLLEPGESDTVEVRMVATQTGRHRNIVHFVADNFPDKDPSNDWDDAPFLVDDRITVRKEAPQNEYLVGKQIPFTIVLKNNGAEEVSDVKVVDTYPALAFEYASDNGNCLPPTFFSLGGGRLTCQIGTLGPGEERTIIVGMKAISMDPPSGFDLTQEPLHPTNGVQAFAGFQLEDSDEFPVAIAGNLPVFLSLFVAGALGAAQKRASDPIDVYLNDARLADDIYPGQAIGFQEVTLKDYPFRVYLVPGEAADRSAAFDSVSVELNGVEQGLSSGIVLTTNADGIVQAVVIDDAAQNATDPDHVDVAVVHAASTLASVDIALETSPEETPIATDLAFGQTSAYAEIKTPGTYNLVVTPTGDPLAAEVFQVALDTPGEAYMLVLAPDTTVGKIDGVTLYALDAHGNVVQPTVVTSTEAGAGPEQPTSFALYGNYPNPFNPTTTIRYDVPEVTTVHVSVYDALGRMVASLVDGQQSAGKHSVTWDASDLPSGVYFSRMNAGSFVETRKMMLLR